MTFKKLRILCFFTVFCNALHSQNIAGIVNTYAAVVNIAGSNIALSSGAGFSAGDRFLLIQMKGAIVVQTNGPTFGDITAIGSAGKYDILTIQSITGATITATSPPVNTYSTTGFVQVVRMPEFCMPTVTNTLSCAPWNPATGTGGVLAFDAGTLTLNSDINVSGLGFTGGNFATSGFCCSNGSYAGIAGGSGGKKGESVSAYITNLDGLKGKQANGGGGSNCGNSGGGGGANAGAGGFGGNQYSGCGNFDDRGVGGASLMFPTTSIFFGGGGGGGFRDNGQTCTNGGNGGGIVFIRANIINGNNRIITADGASVTTITNDEGAGGGGGGGSVFLFCGAYNGALTVLARGGSGGSNNNSIFGSDCHGPGGGGGGGVYAFSTGAAMGGVIFNAAGALPGTVNNPASSCFNTSYGATAGTAGYSLSGLSTPSLAFNVPQLAVTQNSVVCAGQSTTLTATGAASFTWFAGPQTATYAVTPNNTTGYIVTGANLTCSATLIYTVTVIPGSTIGITGPTVMCSGQTVTLAAAGANTYQWNTGSTSSLNIVSPLATTVYTVVGFSSPCTNSISHTLTVVQVPTVTITGTNNICSGQSATLTAGTAQNYFWNTSASTSSIVVSPATSTTYSVLGSNGSCSSTALHTISVTTTPTLVLQGDTVLCSGKQGSVVVTGANSYQWNTGSTSSQLILNPGVSTVYSVTGNIGFCASSKQFTVNVVQTPSFSIFGSNLICSGQTATLNAAPVSTINWNTGATTAILYVAPQITTVFTATALNFPCTYTAQRTVSVVTTPSLTLSTTSNSLCAGNAATLSASGAGSYTWSTGPHTSSIVIAPNVSTTYYLSGSNAHCVQGNSVTITVFNTPVLSSTSYSICKGVETATMIVSGANNYIWNPSGNNGNNSATIVANPIATTIYTVQGISGPCSSTLAVPLHVFPIPTVQLTASNNTVCLGSPVTLTAQGALAYAWQPANQFPNNGLTSVFLIPAGTSVYTLSGFGLNNCKSSVTTTITVLPTPNTRAPVEFYSVCKGQQVVLSVEGADRFKWNPTYGLTTSSGSVIVASPLQSTTYTITGTSGTAPNECSSVAILSVSVLPYADITFQIPDSLCPGQVITLKANGASDYTWTPASYLSNRYAPNPNLKAVAPVMYTVTGGGRHLCESTATLQINIKPGPYVYAGRDTLINFDQPYMLQGEGNGNVFTWFSSNQRAINCINCPVTLLNASQSALYRLEVQNSYGCVSSDEVYVEVTTDHALYVPNSFSPNNDGINDVFMPKGFGVISYTMRIFDRWGELLHEGNGSFTEGVYDSWDGSFKGVVCKSDTYLYSITYTIYGSKKLTKEGPVILLAPKQ